MGGEVEEPGGYLRRGWALERVHRRFVKVLVS
jgi:hypothetical protein